MKVISVTPAGRKDYIEILARHLLQHRSLIDEHHFWVNTDFVKDKNSIQSWCDAYPSFFKAVHIDSKAPRSVKTISNFFRAYCKPDEIYLRFDDDICWIRPDCVKNLLEFRLANREYFLVYANTVNHTTCNLVHQQLGCCPKNIDFYFKGEHASLIHHQFFENIHSGKTQKYLFERHENKAHERMSVNCISWFGADLKPINGILDGNEEQFLAVDYPKATGRINCICGDALVVHFAYSPQRKFLESATRHLEAYSDLALGRHGVKNYVNHSTSNYFL